MKSQKVIFQKSQKLLAENLHERTPIQDIQLLYSFNFKTAGYVTAFNTGYHPCFFFFLLYLEISVVPDVKHFIFILRPSSLSSVCLK